MKSIPYSEERIPEHADWFALLKPGATVPVYLFVSALQKCLIEDAAIYYECVEPDQCSVSVQ